MKSLCCTMQTLPQARSDVTGHLISIRSKKSLLCGAALILVGSHPALAQSIKDPVHTDVASSAAPADNAAIVVTASRAAPTGFDSPAPTTVISNQSLLQQGAANIGQVLIDNPAFKPVANPAASGQRTQNPAQATADLRGLGANRTLVLFNGSRTVPAAAASTGSAGMAADINRIPTLMIDRVEVVTGGASAQWGSDAVAGVVNIILKKRYDGVTLRLVNGISQRGDAANLNISGLAGTSFSDDRGHLVVGADYFHSDAMGDLYTRGWGRKEISLIGNPASATNGLPAQLVTPGVHVSTSPGGLISGPAGFSLRNSAFNPDGTTRPFQFGSLVSGANMIGGEGKAFGRGQSMMPGVERFSTYARLEYELTPNLTAYVEGSYADAEGKLVYQVGRTTQTIRRTNAYLPTAVGAAMDAAGIQSFTLGRINDDFGPARLKVRNRVGQGVAGLEGQLGGGWTWDTHYSFARNVYTYAASNNPITQRLGFATDAVLNNGQIVCAATVSGGPRFNAAANGCVPVNLFGVGSPSAAAIGYVNGTARQRAVYELHNGVVNIQGKPFATWAGDVAIGAGLEYRHEKIRTSADALAQASAYGTLGNVTPFRGAFDVKEGYLEATIPLAKDVAAIRSLDVNGAIRYADYSNFGSRTTWKLGATYEPFDGLRFRATRSRDLRAPALYELFSAGGIVNQTVNVRGFSALIPTNISRGNPDLGPEKADTLTLGAVVEPNGSLKGLRMSVDYFNINLQNAITNFANAAQGLCNGGSALACSFFAFDPVSGAPTSLVTPTVNAASLRYIGYDFGLGYRHALGSVNGTPGAIDISFNGTYLQHAYIDLGIGTGRIDRAGENSALNNGANPHFTSTLSTTYSVGKSSLTTQLRYISKGKLDNTFNTTANNSINNNQVPAALYVNMFGTLAIDEEGKRQFFFAVDNLLDKAPPVAPFPALNTPTNPQYYDIIGRAFRVGVTLKL